VKTLLFTSNTKTKISSDIIIYSGIRKESLSFSKVPATSLLAAIIFGHILLEMIIVIREIPEKTFLDNHPKGGISKHYKKARYRT
jgi:hypothetical protein